MSALNDPRRARAVYAYQNVDGDTIVQLWSGQSDQAPDCLLIPPELVADLLVQLGRIPLPTRLPAH